jgi:hypothetical protein
VASLLKFIKEHPEWGHPDAHVYWKQDGFKHLEMKEYMISSFQVPFFWFTTSIISDSVQETRTCWLHAVVVLQHLLVVKGSGKADHKKV